MPGTCNITSRHVSAVSGAMSGTEIQSPADILHYCLGVLSGCMYETMLDVIKTCIDTEVSVILGDHDLAYLKYLIGQSRPSNQALAR